MNMFTCHIILSLKTTLNHNNVKTFSIELCSMYHKCRKTICVEIDTTLHTHNKIYLISHHISQCERDNSKTKPR